MLALESDWAFMVTKDSAADYARRRAAVHTERFDALADLLRRGDRARAEQLAATYRADDGPFGHLDARALKHN
jgi:1,4-alpha-glucan branching enzyme